MKIVREQSLAKDIVIVDGFSGSGKSLSCGLLTHLKRAELWQLDYFYDYIPYLEGVGKISSDAAEALLKIRADEEIYNLMIGRGVNFRPNDITGVEFNLKNGIYKDRVLKKDGDIIVNEIEKNMPILILHTHYTFEITDLFFRAFKNNLKLFILTTRHPAILFEHWYNQNMQERVNDSRIFTLNIEMDNNIIPYYARNYSKNFYKDKKSEHSMRAILEFDKNFKIQFNLLKDEDKEKVVYLPFEKITQDYDFYIDIFCKKLNTSKDKDFNLIVDKFELPRNQEKNWLEVSKNNFYKVIKEEKADKILVKEFENLFIEYEKKYLI